MYVPGVPLSRSVVWDVNGRRFRMSSAGEKLTLETSDGRLSLSRHEWQGVAAALAVLHPPAPAVPRAAPDPAAPSAGRWTQASDAALTRGWYAGDGLAVLTARLGRSERAIVARLLHLDCVGDRAEARARP